MVPRQLQQGNWSRQTKKSIVYLLSYVPSLSQPCSLSSLFGFDPFSERTSPLIDLVDARKGVLHCDDRNPFQIWQSWFEISLNFFDLCFIFSPKLLHDGICEVCSFQVDFFFPLFCWKNLIKLAFLLIFCEDLCLFGVCFLWVFIVLVIGRFVYGYLMSND